MKQTSDDAWLQPAWLQLMARLAVEERPARDAFARLARRYGEAHRAYHTLAHVAQVLRDLQRLAIHAPNLHQVQTAAWLHDVVYDPRAADNEERSAAYAADLLQTLGQPVELIAGVQRLILLTKSHEAGADDGDGQLLSDADLATLGAPPEIYRRYAAAIRREYAWVDEVAYRPARIAVLRRFLQRPAIYHTATMQQEREQQARNNLHSEIERLARGT